MAKGIKTGGGSRKGVPNKANTELADRIREICGPEFDPVLGRAMLAKTELANLDADVVALELLDKAKTGKAGLAEMAVALRKLAASKAFALSALSEVSQYIHPKRKAVEVSGSMGIHEESLDHLE